MFNTSAYKHVFFDLDDTLWDFEKNCYATFIELFEKFNIVEKINSVKKMYDVYDVVNEKLWVLYRAGKIKKEELRVFRFEQTFKYFNVDDKILAKDFGDQYLEICPQKSIMVENVYEILEYLKPKYKLYILTNGFEETQNKKMSNCGLWSYFEKMITSETIGIQKPKPEIFEYALTSVNAKKKETVMIGDNLLVDIVGARNYGLDQIYFNKKYQIHEEEVTFEVNNLIEIKEIL